MTATEPADPPGQARTRRYRSPLRARQAADTRAALIAAGRGLFLARGWAGTGMRDVAAAAGVSTETVYAHFGSKRGLFEAVVDVAVVGDDRPVALAGRAEFAAMGQGRLAARAAAAGRLLGAVYERTAAFAKVIREAASTDDEIAAVLRETRERQRRDVAAAGRLITGRPLTTAERDGLWALTSQEVYLLLVEESGWTRQQYEAWMAAMVERCLGAPDQQGEVPT